MTLDAFLRGQLAGLEQGSPLAFAVALLAGVIASAVCPCTLPVGLGLAGVAGSSEAQTRSDGLRVALGFFAGIVINLALLGAIAGRLGVLATEAFGRSWALAMAVASLLGAVVAFAGPRLSQKQLKRLRRPGMLGAIGYGFIFSLGTSVAPLILLLTVAATQQSPLVGLFFAVAFGVGRGMPFLLAGVFAGLIARFARLQAWRPALQAISGAALLFVSFYYAKAFVALL